MQAADQILDPSIMMPAAKGAGGVIAIALFGVPIDQVASIAVAVYFSLLTIQVIAKCVAWLVDRRKR